MACEVPAEAMWGWRDGPVLFLDLPPVEGSGRFMKAARLASGSIARPWSEAKCFMAGRQSWPAVKMYDGSLHDVKTERTRDCAIPRVARVGSLAWL